MAAKSRDTSSAPPPPSWSWVKNELDTKANEKYVDVKIDSLQKGLDETKKIALSARKKAGEHMCVKESSLDKITKDIEIQSANIEGIRKTLDGWKTIKIVVIIAIIGVIGAAFKQYYSLTGTVEGTTEKVEEVQVSVKKLENSQESLRVAFEGVKVEEEKKNKKQLKAIEDTIKSAMKASASNTRVGRRNR